MMKVIDFINGRDFLIVIRKISMNLDRKVILIKKKLLIFKEKKQASNVLKIHKKANGKS